jgi:ribosomal protein S27AE/Tfp pilus assembly protein PilZ
MPTISDEVFKRKKQHCPRCGKIIPAAYAAELPCPSCCGLVNTSSLNNSEITANNERTEKRCNASLKVSYNSYNEFITEYTKNVSKGGIFINAKKHHEISEIVDISLIVPGLDRPLIIKGEVVHIQIHNVPDKDARHWNKIY